MRICLLTPQDLETTPFPADDWPCDPRPYLPDATWHVETLEKETSVQAIRRLAREGFDVFFNLCDGTPECNVPGIEVVRALERLNLPFTGATSEFYEPSRVTMKRVCRELGIATPAHVLARTERDVERAARHAALLRNDPEVVEVTVVVVETHRWTFLTSVLPK